MTRHVRRRTFHPGIHISPEPIHWGWKITRNGRVVAIHRTQRKAFRAGKRLANRLKVPVNAHDQDGRFVPLGLMTG